MAESVKEILKETLDLINGVKSEKLEQHLALEYAYLAIRSLTVISILAKKILSASDALQAYNTWRNLALTNTIPSGAIKNPEKQKAFYLILNMLEKIQKSEPELPYIVDSVGFYEKQLDKDTTVLLQALSNEMRRIFPVLKNK